MRRSFRLLVAVLLWSPFLVPRSADARELTFRERVAAQEAIERVYYRHQIGATVPFEEAVPRAVIERKVETTLKLTEALRIYWRTDVDSNALRRELARIATSTRFPDRLREIERALGDDAFLMQECLARPVLVERLARSFFAADASTEAAGPRTWEEWWTEASPRLDGRGTVSAACAGAVMPAIGSEGCASTFAPLTEGTGIAPAPAPPSPPCLNDVWSSGVLDDEPPALEGMASAWTGSLLVVWGGLNMGQMGARYDPATDSWQRVSTIGAPSLRQGHRAVWAGGRVVVWGGIEWLTGSYVNTGGRYDPVADTWTSTSTVGAPAPRSNNVAVSTGSTMIVWGGFGDTILGDTGGRYDVASDTWTATSLLNAPEPRSDAAAVWTGSRMLVWGGFGLNTPVDTGGSYDPGTDTWTALSTAGAPSPRFVHTGVWSGGQFIVWGGLAYDGLDFTKLGTGGRYDPATDTWADTSVAGAPAARYYHSAVWTGSRMIVWGGRGADEFSRSDGGLYDPAADTWSPTATAGAPQARSQHAAAWTGSLMIVWGGDTYDGSSAETVTTGGRYNPASNTWTPTFTTGAPSARTRHEAIWTGNVMMVWGGYNSIATGSRYNPTTDSWSPTTLVNAPTGRDQAYTIVWTGTRAIVWGGVSWDGNVLNDGGRYDPIADAWTATSTTGAPSGRTYHAAVWTGTQMIIWGGIDLNGPLGDGGRYDPASNTWQSMSMVNAPTARSNHAAVWSGKVMVVWGGYDSNFTNTGGRYNPMNDTWQSVSTVNAPEPRRDPATVWTGSQMVIWGGFGNDWFNSGGRYNPKNDMWQPTSLTGAPAPRETLTGVWTGKVMIVWGGRGVVRYGDGGRYNPKTDAWQPVSTTGAPIPRYEHVAVWADNQMIVWGGTGFDDSSRLNDGGRYFLCP
jgi:N-acetylneuraminic acid mutarotase